LLLKRLSATDVPVLLRGETGVGKEVLARKLHEESKRAGRPFLKLNCAALPSELVESELFGYERGAFTGAFKNTPGKFEMANNGTILLDEIGDMDFRLQAKLLQVLQDREFLRLGAKETSRVDVRVIAATHCDLEKAITDARFREDLYYRLNIIEVHVPPLRERKDEVIVLANFFLKKHSTADAPEIPLRLRQALLEHDWPGNIRELENVMRKFLVFGSAEMIVAELKKARGAVAANGQMLEVATTKALYSAARYNKHESSMSRNILEPVLGNRQKASELPIPDCIQAFRFATAPERTKASASASPASVTPHLDDSSRGSSILADVDRARKRAEVEAITEALNSTFWHRKQTAKLLKIDYKTLLYKMKKLGIGEKTAEVSTIGVKGTE
jgi:two-component system response regulator AtoC